MPQKRPKIVVVKEGFTATNVAEDSVSTMVKKPQVLDAVETMATDFEPGESDILANEEFRLVFAQMTETEAKNLQGKAGVESVEDDEVNYALTDEFEGSGDMADEFIEEDLEAAQEIDEAFQDLEAVDQAEVTPEDAALACQVTPEFSEIDLDENGNIMHMGDSVQQRMEAAGIPRKKIQDLIKCIIKCAIENFSGKVHEVPDEKINEFLAGLDLDTSDPEVQATRDYITCGLRIIYAPYAWRFSTGAGVRVAVVDTGIAPRHPDLRVYGGASFVPGVPRWYDDHGHGTHVAGTIAAVMNRRGVVGVAPHARLYAVKVLNRAGSGYTSWILNGLAWCYRYRMHIVNLSLGSIATTHDPRNYSRAYEGAGQRLRRRGILPVAAAGNSGSTSRPYVGNPGRCPSFMAVSSIDCRRRRSSFSSYGPQVEICAPGSNVLSTYPPNTYRRLSGTSMASPHVAGVAALVKRRYPAWPGDRIRVHLWRTALDLGRPGRDWFFGYGQVRAYPAVR